MKSGKTNLSEALRQLLADGARVRAGHAVEVSEACAAELDRLAKQTGLPREEVTRLALTYAVERAHDWLPTRENSSD